MSNTIDQQFVEFVVKSLVGNPDAVSIARSVDDKGVLLELTVDPEDLGRVIGKRGATAQSLRTLLRALGTKNEALYNLKIVDNVVFPDRKQGDDSSVASPSNDDTASVAPVAVADDEPEEFETASEVESDVVAKTRAELDDLDDLDI